MAKDFLVATGNPEALDSLLRMNFTAALIEDSAGVYMKRDGAYVMRCFGNNADYTQWAIAAQGYAKVLGPIVLDEGGR